MYAVNEWVEDVFCYVQPGNVIEVDDGAKVYAKIVEYVVRN